MTVRRILVGVLASVGVACGGSHTQEETTAARLEVAEAALERARQVAHADRGSWIALTGTVVDAEENGFSLDYGGGVVVVEMGEFEDYPAARTLIENDNVIVYGRLDDDFFEARSVDARVVYIKDLGTHLFASDSDEREFPTNTVVDFTPRVELSGVVTGVAGRTFRLDTGAGTLAVDTGALDYDPLDSEGFQRVRIGDRVRVAGRLGDQLFDEHDLKADVVLSMGVHAESESGRSESTSSESEASESRTRESGDAEADESSDPSAGVRGPDSRSSGRAGGLHGA